MGGQGRRIGTGGTWNIRGDTDWKEKKLCFESIGRPRLLGFILSSLLNLLLNNRSLDVLNNNGNFHILKDIGGGRDHEILSAHGNRDVLRGPIPSNDAGHDYGKDPEHPQQDANSTTYVCIIIKDRINERGRTQTYQERTP